MSVFVDQYRGYRWRCQNDSSQSYDYVGNVLDDAWGDPQQFVCLAGSGRPYYQGLPPQLAPCPRPPLPLWRNDGSNTMTASLKHTTPTTLRNVDFSGGGDMWQWYLLSCAKYVWCVCLCVCLSLSLSNGTVLFYTISYLSFQVTFKYLRQFWKILWGNLSMNCSKSRPWLRKPENVVVSMGRPQQYHMINDINALGSHCLLNRHYLKTYTQTRTLNCRLVTSIWFHYY